MTRQIRISKPDLAHQGTSAARTQSISLGRRRLQPKLNVSQQHDPFEREADQRADESLSGERVGTITPTQPDSSALSLDTSEFAVGSPLPSSVRASMEGRFGTGFGDVKIHTDAEAAALNHNLNARAVTVGKDIFFGSNAYRPETTSGMHLIAHELTHVVQQSGSAERVQRNGDTETTPDIPENRFLEQVRLIREDALRRFQEAIDTVREGAASGSGDYLLAHWVILDTVANQLNQQSVMATTVPPAPSVPARAATSTSTPPTTPIPSSPAPTTTTTVASSAPPVGTLPPHIQHDYDEIRRAVLVGLTTQRYRNRLLLRQERVPPHEGDLGFYISDQTQHVTWVVKDTAALLTLLQREVLTESEQWTAVGLLRQHQNPWNFAYMIAVLDENRVLNRFNHFAEQPARAYVALRDAQTYLATRSDLSPAGRLGSFQLRFVERKIVLLQPMSPSEIAAELYGDGDRWQTFLRPYNRAVLDGVGANTWLQAGTELIIDPSVMVDSYKQLFAMAAFAVHRLRDTPTNPTITVQPASAAFSIVTGNTVRYAIGIQNAAFADTPIHWWVENDPIAVRDHHLPARVDGPDGQLSWGGTNRNTTWELVAAAPGNHVIKCRLTHSDSEEVATFTQTVMTLEEATEITARRDGEFFRNPRDLLEDLRRQRREMGDRGNRQAREALDERIRQIETSIREADSRWDQAHMVGVRAWYVSATEQPISGPLRIYFGRNTEYNSADTGYHFRLWDYTLGAPAYYSVDGEGRRANDTVVELMRKFADDAPYPRGNIRFDLSDSLYIGVDRQTVIFPTDGGTWTVALLRAFSMASLAVGVVGALALQPEIALPAFALSGILAGVAGVADIAERLEHGRFQWDVQTGLDILDIVGALVSFGGSSAVTATARGVGRISLRGTIQVATGVGQIGIMAGIHLTQIVAALNETPPNRERVLEAVLHAIADGALIIIVHRSASRLSSAGGRGGARPSETETPTVRSPEPVVPGTTRPSEATMAGTTRGTTPAPTPDPAAPVPPETVYAEPGTPQYYRLLHESWAAAHSRRSVAPVDTSLPPPDPTPPRAGTVATIPPGDNPVAAADRAYRIFEETMARAPGREVAIYRNVTTGDYQVRLGTERQVFGPLQGNWETVLHNHPNPENVLTYRMPAPNDVENTALQAFRARRPITEFIEFTYPDGRRGRARFTVDPNGRIQLEYVSDRTGRPVIREYADLNQYQNEWSSRTRAVDPSSPEYQDIIRDLHEYYRNRDFAGVGEPPELTMAGSRRGRGTPPNPNQQDLFPAGTPQPTPAVPGTPGTPAPLPTAPTTAGTNPQIALFPAPAAPAGSPALPGRPPRIRTPYLSPIRFPKGSPERLLERWRLYQLDFQPGGRKAGQTPLSWEGWLAVYAANQSQAANAARHVVDYHGQLGWGTTAQVELPAGTANGQPRLRRLDVTDVPSRRGAEVKSGEDVSLDGEITYQISCDQWLNVNGGWDIHWYFAPNTVVRQPVIDALNGASIRYVLHPTATIVP